MASPSSSLAPEIILPLSSQKHDPAWKHCLMIKKGDRTHLKCMYCVKLFSGGGIHRIKEHLACQKGNASSCSKVPPEVRDAMLQSLEGVVVRKKKKQKLAEEVKKLTHATSLDTLIPGSEAENDLPLVAVPIDSVEPCAFYQEKKDEGALVVKSPERRGRRRTKISPVTSPKNLDVAISERGHGSSTREQVHMSIGRFLYEAGVPLDAVNSVHFQSMIDAIATAGPGLAAPSYHDVRGWILKNSLDEVKSKLQQWKATWSRTGCSILADEWTTEINRTLINFLVYCPEGTIFLKSVDASQIVTSADALYELLKHVVEEVGVRDVVQVITNNSETYAIAGKMLTETFSTMFWTPCSAHCVDLMLKDFSKLEQISLVLEQAQSITGFVYTHAPLLNMLKRHTGGKDLLNPSTSSFATNFMTLKTMITLKDNLHAMVTSKEWMDSPYSKLPGSVMIADLICNSSFWSSCATIVHLTELLVRVLRIVDGNIRPAMGYIHISMRCAKERIRKELKKKSYYLPYWNIIDWRWDKDLARPLHMAGFFLNPQFFFKIKGEIPNEIMSGMLDCIERLVPDVKIQDKINKELSLYKNASGDFARKMAIRARETLLPAEWWSTYGGGCPNLSRLAIRILSQTCSARGCDRSHIPFEKIHSQRMNSLEQQRFNDLIFVQYNLRLQQRQFSKKKALDPLSADNHISNAEDWLVEKSGLLSGEVSSSWMELAQPVTNAMPPEYANDEGNDPFAIGFDDEWIDGVGDEDDDDDEEDIKHQDVTHSVKAEHDARNGTYFGNNLF